MIITAVTAPAIIICVLEVEDDSVVSEGLGIVMSEEVDTIMSKVFGIAVN